MTKGYWSFWLKVLCGSAVALAFLVLPVAAGAQSEIDISAFVDPDGEVDVTGYLAASKALSEVQNCAPVESADLALPASVSPSTVAAGGSVTVSGSGFEPGSSLTGTLCCPSSVVGIGTVVADAAGAYSITSTIPTDAQSGTCTMAVSGAAVGGVKLMVSFGSLVVQGSGGLLPVTGSEIGTLVGVATALVLAGVGFAYAARRKRANGVQPGA